MNIYGLRFENTCGACPEQYDVFLEGEQVGYVRVRHGWVSAEYPDCGGTHIYSDYIHGDGSFEDTAERMKHLRLIATLLHGRIQHNQLKISQAHEVVERLMDAIGNSDVGVFVVHQGVRATVDSIYVDGAGDVIVEVE